VCVIILITILNGFLEIVQPGVLGAFTELPVWKAHMLYKYLFELRMLYQYNHMNTSQRSESTEDMHFAGSHRLHYSTCDCNDYSNDFTQACLCENTWGIVLEWLELVMTKNKCSKQSWGEYGGNPPRTPKHQYGKGQWRYHPFDGGWRYRNHFYKQGPTLPAWSYDTPI
jgi:hypothetical protein